MNRKLALQRLASETFDVCVIGGGASGAGVALDAQLRGLRTALVERDDFAAATSGKSTKLVHGGVRYLEQAVKTLDLEQFRMVRKALRERQTMLANAPYLAKPLALLTPCYTWIESWYYAIGMKMYDLLAGRTNLRGSRRLSVRGTRKRMPTLSPKTLYGSVLYYDGQFDDARYNVVLAKTAAQAGAAVANHAQVIDFEKDADGKLCAAHVRDTLTGAEWTLRARAFVNATGPYADAIRQRANPRAAPRMRVSKGAHVVLPRHVMPGDTAMLIPKTHDGRVVFVIPWLDKVLLGTTDTEMHLTDGEPRLQTDEVTYLLRYFNEYFATQLTPDQVESGFAGMRPLLQADPTAATKNLVRDHEVEIDAASGLVSLLGGKWTTYRLMAQDTVDALLPRLGLPATPATTATHPLSGAEGYYPDGWRIIAQEYGLTEPLARHLWQRYGTNAAQVAQLTRDQPDLAQPLAASSEGYQPGNDPVTASGDADPTSGASARTTIRAEVVYAVRHEMACTPADVLARRLGLELTDWPLTRQLIGPVAALMAAELGWSPADANRHAEAYAQRLASDRAAAFAASTAPPPRVPATP